VHWPLQDPLLQQEVELAVEVVVEVLVAAVEERAVAAEVLVGVAGVAEQVLVLVVLAEEQVLVVVLVKPAPALELQTGKQRNMRKRCPQL
jgi:hypothetical protein